MATYTDDFNRTDSATLGSAWTAQSDAMLGISSNQARVNATGYGSYYFNTGGTGSADMYTTAQVTGPTGGTGYIMASVTARHSTSAQTCYAMQLIYVGDWVLYLVRRVAESDTTIDSTVIAAPSFPVTMRIETEGSTIRGFLAGTQRFSVTDTGITSGDHGGVLTQTGDTTYSTGPAFDSWETGSLSSGTNYTSSPGDAEGITDAAGAVQANARTVADTAGVTDSTSAVQANARGIADSAGITDAATAVIGASIGVGDTLGVTDSLSVETVNDETTTEPVGLTDSASVAQANARGPADTAGVTDAAAAVLAAARAIVDNASITDAVTVDYVTSGNVTTGDALGLADTAAAAQETTRAQADTASITDAVTVALDRVVTIDDLLSLVDAVAPDVTSGAASYTATPSDTATIADAVTVAMVLERVLEDVVTTSDGYAKIVGGLAQAARRPRASLAPNPARAELS